MSKEPHKITMQMPPDYVELEGKLDEAKELLKRAQHLLAGGPNPDHWSPSDIATGALADVQAEWEEDCAKLKAEIYHWREANKHGS